jgi:hypothetical protein
VSGGSASEQKSGLPDIEDAFEEATAEEDTSDEIAPDALLQLEEGLQAISRRIGDALMVAFIRTLLDETDLDREAVRAFKDSTSQAYKDEGKRTVTVHFAGGTTAQFEVSYLRLVSSSSNGRSKRHGNRGSFGSGVFPVLEVLGVHVVHSKMKASPLLENRVVYAATASDSHEAARDLLEKWGIDWYEGRLQNFLERSGTRHRQQQADWLEDANRGGPLDPDEIEGERVVISTDGGRCRLRANDRGRPRESGYHGFDAEWREPKLFCIYVVDEQGQRRRDVRSIIDGSIVEDDDEVGADALFERLEAYLEALDIERAEEVIVTGDGAPWIWGRARPMLSRLGVESDDITEVIDWYHARETIYGLAEAATAWPLTRQIPWRKKTLSALGEGDIEQVVDQIEALPDAVEDVYGDKRDYFRQNEARMNYPAFEEAGVPKGSGAVESAVRRVVNQRMKSNATYWNRDNAETMLMWRGYLKSSRLDDFMRWTRRDRARWWLDSRDTSRDQDAVAASSTVFTRVGPYGNSSRTRSRSSTPSPPTIIRMLPIWTMSPSLPIQTSSSGPIIPNGRRPGGRRMARSDSI